MGKFKRKFLPLLTIFAISFLLIHLIPLYHPLCGFYFPYTGCRVGKKFVFAEGRTPLLLLEYKNYKENGTFIFSGNGDEDWLYYKLRINNSIVDFVRFKNSYFPLNLLSPSVLLAVYLSTSFQTVYSAYHFLLLLETAVISTSLLLIYDTIVNRTKNVKLSFLLSILLLLTTSIFIYSRYLFLKVSFQLLGVSGIYHSLLSKRNRKIKKMEFFVFLWVLLFSSYLYEAILFSFVIFLLILRGYIRVEKKLFLIGVIVFLFLHWKTCLSFFPPDFHKYESMLDLSDIPHFSRLFAIFPKYIHSYNLEISPLYRFFIYSFKEGPGNSIFLRVYPLFAYLFSPSGIFYNTPYLLLFLFIILIKWKGLEKEEKAIFLLSILFYVTYSSFSINWRLGYTPRYVRYSQLVIPAFFIISSRFLKEFVRNKIFLVIFVVLAFFSFLNVFSIAVRSDWSSPSPDYPSPDYALVPLTEHVPRSYYYFDLTQYAEQSRWITDHGRGKCNPLTSFPQLSTNGLVIGPCLCSFETYAYRRLEFPPAYRFLTVEACGPNKAKMDGKIADIYIDEELIGKLFVPDKECVREYFNISKFADGTYHTIKIAGKLYGRCTDESIVISSIAFSLDDSNASLITYDIFLDFLSWEIEPKSRVDERGIWTKNSSAKYSGIFPKANKLNILVCGTGKAEIIFNERKREIYLDRECEELGLEFTPYEKFNLTLKGEEAIWSRGYFR